MRARSATPARDRSQRLRHAPARRARARSVPFWIDPLPWTHHERRIRWRRWQRNRIARPEAEAPNQRWVGDTTELLTASGKFFLAAIVDLYARMVHPDLNRGWWFAERRVPTTIARIGRACCVDLRPRVRIVSSTAE